MSPDLRQFGRFDKSFFVHMVASFLLFTLAVAAVELGLRFGALLYEFHKTDREVAQLTAERLANDVRSIMLNRGGPVASRTVYPILRRTFEQAGLQVAIEPSPATTSSIRTLFGFEPRGIPPEWPAGTHHEGRVELRAEEFCLQCHGDAGVGDVLGTVTVRDYLGARLEGWWKDVRLTGALNVVKIVIHTVILFFLLRALLEPLWSLRAAVGELAKGGAGLSTRAAVRSSDEFGELAHDLNAFLDRVNHILSDLKGTTGKMVSANTRLAQVTGRTREQLAKVERALEAALPAGADAGDRLAAHLPRLVHEVHELRHMLDEIGFLESQLDDVAAAGRALLDRLLTPGTPTVGAAPDFHGPSTV